MGRRADRARLTRPLRREARGDRLRDRDRRPAADPELVLPPGLLGGASRRLPQAQAADPPRLARRHPLGAGARARGAGLLERLPRRLRDGALPAGADPGGRHPRRPARRHARPRRDAGRRRADDPARAQAAAPEDADRDRDPDDVGARDPRRHDDPDVPGRRVAAGDADRGVAAAVLGRRLARASTRPGRASAPRRGRRCSWSAATSPPSSSASGAGSGSSRLRPRPRRRPCRAGRSASPSSSSPS